MRGLSIWLLCVLLVACAGSAGSAPPSIRRDAGSTDLPSLRDQSDPTDRLADDIASDGAVSDAPADIPMRGVPYVGRAPSNRLLVIDGATMFVTSDKVRYGWGDGLGGALGQRWAGPGPRPPRRTVERVDLDEERYHHDFSPDGICRWRKAGGGPVQCWGWLGIDRIQTQLFVPEPRDEAFSDADLVEVIGCASRSDGVWCWPPRNHQRPDFVPVATRRYDRPFCTFLPNRRGLNIPPTRCGYDCGRQQIVCNGLWWTHELARDDAGSPADLGTLDNYGWIVPFRDVASIGYVGGTTFHVTRSDGTLWCRGGCGGDRVGTFGPPRDEFRQVLGLPPVVYAEGATPAPGLDARTYHGCALLRDGTVTCWGGCSPQIGGGRCTGDRNTLLVIERVGGLTNVVELAMNDVLSCVRTADEQVWCWGDNGEHAVHPAMDARLIWEPVRVEMPPRS